MKTLKKFIGKARDLIVKVEDGKFHIILWIDVTQNISVYDKEIFTCDSSIENGTYHFDIPAYTRDIKKCIKLITTCTLKVEDEKMYFCTDAGNKILMKNFEFPLGGYGKENEDYSINKVSRNFLEDMKKAAMCSSCDRNRYFMMGVYLDIERNSLVSTDGRRCVAFKYTDQVKAEFNKRNVLIHKDFIKLIDTKKESELFISEHHSCISTEDYYLWSDLIEGQFPNYTKVIPQYNNVTLFKMDFSILEKLPRDIINKVEITKDSVQFYSLENWIDAALLPVPDDKEVSFNKDFLLDLWKFYDKKDAYMNVSFNENDLTRAWKFEADNMVYIVMPMNN